MSRPPRKPGRTPDLDQPWDPGDAIAQPEAVHHDGESAWAMWNELAQRHEARFAQTRPMTVPSPLSSEQRAWADTEPAAAAVSHGARSAAPLFTLDTAMLVARRNNRVCPRPERWAELAALLPARKTLRGWQQPPAPVTGGAWAVTPPLTKRLCFREQIEWAEREGVLENLMAFMQAMREEDWLHMGEG